MFQHSLLLQRSKKVFLNRVLFEGAYLKEKFQKSYNTTHCISRIKTDAAISVSMIDGCHIIPFSKNYNDTIINGITLCPNLHKAFDRALITIDKIIAFLYQKGSKKLKRLQYQVF